ncbi:MULTISPECIES: PD-(D/E)XK nuclease-like domain-containing protein [unclassified Pantoea]|uniref:PD-(D/E)XK nuclease-like domain-containing protein n=1 Tax=unclassified Pantoea TaxID=2630326 RepID=UPI001CD194AB|nr:MULTISPECIES: PD-(D/E)XK nuclease-like domain-containing protein [unclassified Pantoea]MCA1176669.1 PD-(D/E)XK nuclease-like domain-containing protein [Pantoea sp. alder69]MCA1251582.1 PD-(D/E)XK nuclease-like domain-containing protein [Pantoea sp. alder70]MCA1264287.1 PD-(D/E)XK nuclease-like domain-containing protein [Pantoea sp. alder81]
MTPGIYHGLSNEAYHSGPGVSKSQLDDIAIDPSFYRWRQKAPIDDDKKSALNMGSALHCLLLEPDEFDKRFIIAPEFNRRTNQGKADEQAFLKEVSNMGMTVLDAEQGRKLTLMRESVLAHHGALFFLESEGHCESSIYWNDPETEELCRIRPDKFLTNTPTLIDIKKVCDMSRFSRHIEEFRYHVQDAFYREGFLKHFGEYPEFVFIAVSESIDCGRYPVHTYVLDQHDIAVGQALFRKNLNTYHQCRLTNEWGGIEIISRPDWARKQDNFND